MASFSTSWSRENPHSPNAAKAHKVGHPGDGGAQHAPERARQAPIDPDKIETRKQAYLARSRRDKLIIHSIIQILLVIKSSNDLSKILC